MEGKRNRTERMKKMSIEDRRQKKRTTESEIETQKENMEEERE